MFAAIGKTAYCQCSKKIVITVFLEELKFEVELWTVSNMCHLSSEKYPNIVIRFVKVIC